VSTPRHGIGCISGSLISAILALVAVSCSSEKEPTSRFTPSGEPVGSSAKACGGYLDRSDLQAIFDDPTRLTQTKRLETLTLGSCGLYDPSEKRYVLTFDITPDRVEFDRELENDPPRPGAIFRGNNASAFNERVGGNARALVRLPRRYVVVYLRRGPMTPDRLNLLLDIAEKIAATVPAPFGTAKPTPTDGPDGTGSTASQSGRVSGS
jgi:hypothetical protein